MRTAWIFDNSRHDGAQAHDGIREVMTRGFEPLDVVRLRDDSPEHGLARGTIGAIVHVYHGCDDAFEVEVIGHDGRPLFLGALPASLLDRVDDRSDEPA